MQSSALTDNGPTEKQDRQPDTYVVSPLTDRGDEEGEEEEEKEEECAALKIKEIVER